jgi:hypothetical protein
MSFENTITVIITEPTTSNIIPFEPTNDYVKIIENLYIKYKNYPYALHRLNIHIENLPSTLEQEIENHEKRQNRNAILNSEQKTFIQVFLKKHQYYYHSHNNTFFEYDNKHYNKIKEDDILYNLLTGISKDDILIQWKYKTKTNVIKIIKERNLLKSIPETYTIQRILKFLTPSIFKTKNETKYFLTILGDNILKKKNNNIYLTNSATKKLLNEIDNLICYYLGLNNVNNNFITKYHENNNYENYRLVNTLDIISIEFIHEIIKKLDLDLLCVACHYSTRYTSSDNFLETKIEDELKNRVLFLKMNTQKSIFDNFCEQYIEQLQSSDNILIDSQYSITWKNMSFIWKKYISNLGIPNVMFYNTIKNLMKDRFEYDENEDVFKNVTSKYLPVISEFIRFWDECIVYDVSLQMVYQPSPICSPTDYYILNNESFQINNYNQIIQKENNFANELEIDEILILFKYWCKSNTTNTPSSILSLSTFYETDILKILHHFYPQIKIVNDKFISYLQCNLWNKNKDIDNALKQLRETYKKQNKDIIIDFSDAYYFYAVYVSNLNTKSKPIFESTEWETDYNNELGFTMDHDLEVEQNQKEEQDIDNNLKHIVVNKRYFEEYLKFTLSKYIVFDNFISTEWYSDI